MAKFIYDTKSIMTRAWELARVNHKQIIKRNPDYRISLCMGLALDKAWAEAKEAMVKAVAASKAQKSSRGRYIELLSVAERNDLNHGRAWFCGDYDIECRGVNPMFEGESICYVYAH